MKKVSILVPAYNENEGLELLYDALIKAFTTVKHAYSWEVLFVNDGSKDNTLEVMRRIHTRDNRFCYLDLSRNFGKEIAMLAGFDYVTGNCTIIMDADLQDPPALIPQMLEKWEEGYEDVYAERLDRGKESFLRKQLSLMYYSLLQKSTKVDVLKNVGDFRLLDKRCIEALRKIRETERYTKGMFSWIGFKKYSIKFDRADRVMGHSTFNFFKLFKLAIEGFTSFTTMPLRLSSFLGFFISIVAFIYLVYVLVKALIYGDPVAGYPTLMTVILFLGGSILMTLGVIGEYLARIFVETKQRTTYIAREYNNELI